MRNFAAKLDVLDISHGRLRGVSPTSAFQMLKDLARSALAIQVVCLAENRIHAFNFIQVRYPVWMVSISKGCKCLGWRIWLGLGCLWWIVVDKIHKVFSRTRQQHNTTGFDFVTWKMSVFWMFGESTAAHCRLQAPSERHVPWNLVLCSCHLWIKHGQRVHQDRPGYTRFWQQVQIKETLHHRLHGFVPICTLQCLFLTCVWTHRNTPNALIRIHTAYNIQWSFFLTL